MGTVMGGGENAIASGALAEVTTFGFLDWMRFGAPLVLLLMPLSWWLLARALPVKDVVIDTAPAHAELAELGALKTPEREILLVLALAVLFWVAGSSLEQWLNLPDTLLSSAVIAVSAVALLSIEEVVDWNDLRRVNWGVFFVIGAGLTLGDAFTKSGASSWFAQMLAPALQGLPYPAILSLLVLLSFVLTQFLNNVPLGAMLAPVLVTLSQASGMAPVSLVVPTIMALAPAYMLPVASARMTLVAVTGLVEKQQMMRTGLIVGLPTTLVILAFFLTLSYFGWL
jgi:sodium-dependent dicarboxylate transporter 2/3/5